MAQQRLLPKVRFKKCGVTRHPDRILSIIMLNNPFPSLKETALQVALKALINQEIEEFGVVTELDIDTNKKTMRVELDLKGETSPILINVASYALSEKNGATHLALENVIASREWIAAVLNKYVVGRAFQLPRAAKMLL